MIIFHFISRALGIEVPLLSHDLPERLPAIHRPTQGILLRARSTSLHEVHPDPAEPLWMGEYKPDRLLSRLRGTPP